MTKEERKEKELVQAVQDAAKVLDAAKKPTEPMYALVRNQPFIDWYNQRRTEP